MASSAAAAEIQAEAICIICLEYLTEPVTLTCGHNFCRVCITQCCEEWEKGARTELTCPQCRAPFQKGAFKPNTQLNNIVQKIKQLGLNPGKGKEPEVDLCERHNECLKLFCEEDGEAICWVCEKSWDHKSHTVVPIEEAAQENKVKLQRALGPLRKELEQVLALKSKEEKKRMEWQRRVKEKREAIVGEFNRLHTLLREEEQDLLQRLAEEERETLRKLQENVTNLSQQSSSLQQLIAEIEKKCQQEMTTELLKDARSTLARSQSVNLQEPGSISIDLTNVYIICLDMMVTLKRFWVDVTLDPDTANPWLVLSEDQKQVRHGDKRQDLPDNPERFDSYPEVLGAEGFMGGRRYWEVEVGDKIRWDLGVCGEAGSRKGLATLTPRNGYWVLGLRDGIYEACISSRKPLPVSVRPRRVGIFLDYEGGEVSFYNVTDRSHLYTVTCTFTGTLRPYFYTGFKSGGKNAAPLIICPLPAQAGGNLGPCQ